MLTAGSWMLGCSEHEWGDCWYRAGIPLLSAMGHLSVSQGLSLPCSLHTFVQNRWQAVPAAPWGMASLQVSWYAVGG